MLHREPHPTAGNDDIRRKRIQFKLLNKICTHYSVHIHHCCYHIVLYFIPVQLYSMIKKLTDNSTVTDNRTEQNNRKESPVPSSIYYVFFN